MILLEKICEELGVRVNEEWKDRSGNKFKINYKDGLMFWSEEDKEWKIPRLAGLYYGLLTGQFNPIWKPKYGEEYQTPQLGSHLKFASKIWYDHESDDILMRRGLVFKTSDEAIAAADKMLESLKE